MQDTAHQGAERQPWGPARESDQFGGTSVTFDIGPGVFPRVVDDPRGRGQMAQMAATLNEAFATAQALCREVRSLRERVESLEAAVGVENLPDLPSVEEGEIVDATYDGLMEKLAEDNEEHPEPGDTVPDGPTAAED